MSATVVTVEFSFSEVRVRWYMGRVLPDPSRGDGHMAQVPVKVTSTLTSAKLIKPTMKPWLFGHIKLRNAEAEKVESTS